MRPEQIREMAALFYFKPGGITWGMRDWINGGSADGVNEDVITLAREFAHVYGMGFSEGRKLERLIQARVAGPSESKAE